MQIKINQIYTVIYIDKHEYDYTIKVQCFLCQQSLIMLVNLLCNLHKMDLRVIQTTVIVVLLDQSDFHLCGTTQCDNNYYVVMAMAY